MTPERLQEIRDRVTAMHDSGVSHAWLTWATEMADYVDLLHEDLRITRAERDAEKKNMKLRQDAR